MHNHVAFFSSMASLQHKTVYTVMYSVKTVKLVFHYDQDMTSCPRDYLTPIGLSDIPV